MNLLFNLWGYVVVESEKGELGCGKWNVGIWMSEMESEKLEVRYGNWGVGSGMWVVGCRMHKVGSKK